MNYTHMLRKLLASDSSISLLLHALKSVMALAINWMVLAQFPSADYVTWAVSSSILVVATASDLGIGQYATTKFIHASQDQWPAIVRESMAALVPLALGAVAFVYIALGSQPAVYKAAMGTFIGLRVLSIPFGATLNAVNQFKLRKAIEVGVYFVSTVLIAWVAYASKPLLWALLILNAAFMVGGFVTMQFATRYINTHTLWAVRTNGVSLGSVYRSSIPFMVNNLTGLLTYGGFIWVSSFILSTEALAKLAVLHTFILINVYQVYDVVLRARQADLVDRSVNQRLYKFNIILMLAIPIVAMLFGHEIIQVITSKHKFTTSELVLFASLVSTELGFLLVQSMTQVRISIAKNLSLYACIKVGFQGVSVFSFWFFGLSQNAIDLYVGGLAAFSLIAYILCFWHFTRQNLVITFT